VFHRIYLVWAACFQFDVPPSRVRDWRLPEWVLAKISGFANELSSINSDNHPALQLSQKRDILQCVRRRTGCKFMLNLRSHPKVPTGTEVAAPGYLRVTRRRT
jgi:hypothetical protein